MSKKFHIGLFTSAWDEVAWKLISAVQEAIKSGVIPNAEIAFLLCTREEGETNLGDILIWEARKAKLPLVTFSSLHFKPDIRKLGREAMQRSDLSILEVWRNEHDCEIMKLVPATDLDVLLGYMWEISGMMCRVRKIINLHPALPTGPKGTYREVIWELVRSRAAESGVMMHLITEELDRGPAVSFCRFSIRGGAFDPFWQEREQCVKCEPLDQIAAKEGEDNSLFKLIRSEGVKREFPMVIGAIKNIAEGKIGIEKGMVVDSRGQIIENGYDLTQEINAAIADKSEKEVE